MSYVPHVHFNGLGRPGPAGAVPGLGVLVGAGWLVGVEVGCVVGVRAGVEVGANIVGVAVGVGVEVGVGVSSAPQAATMTANTVMKIPRRTFIPVD